MLSNVKNLITNKIFLVLGPVVLIFVGSVVFRQYQERRAVQREISELSGQAQTLQQKNSDLKNLLAYLQTSDYKQKAARQQLDLKRDGEVVYTFAAQDSGDASVSPGSAAAGGPTEISNPRKWWNYFFNSN